jgi:hypothetical protein
MRIGQSDQWLKVWQWETNTGMIWGLFASAPVIVRIESPNYEASEWCRRETEMLRYVETTCDFRADRSVIDMNVAEVPLLDRIYDIWAPTPNPISLRRPEFPPLCNVYVPSYEQEWTLRMLRAAAAVRIFHAIYGAKIANELVGGLCVRPEDPPVPVPTNNPDGWLAYRKVFRELQNDCGLEGDRPPLQLPDGAAPWDPDEIQRLIDPIPDLSHEGPQLKDVLAALEWQRTLVPLLEEMSIGDMTLIALRDVSRETWETHVGLSLARALPHWVSHRGLCGSCNARIKEWTAGCRGIGPSSRSTPRHGSCGCSRITCLRSGPISSQIAVGWSCRRRFLRCAAKRNWLEESLLGTSGLLSNGTVRGLQQKHTSPMEHVLRTIPDVKGGPVDGRGLIGRRRTVVPPPKER